MYATNIAVPAKKIVLGGKALLSIAAVVPKDMSKKGLQLLVGKSIKGSSVAGVGDAHDAYYDVSTLQVPEQGDETQHVLKKINLFPMN